MNRSTDLEDDYLIKIENLLKKQAELLHEIELLSIKKAHTKA